MSDTPALELIANLDWLYGALPLPERFAAAARDGFRAVEMLAPYAEPPAWYAAQLRAHGLTLVLHNTPMAPDGAGQRGWAAVAGAERDFAQAMGRARAVAEATGSRRIHVMAGDTQGLDAADCAATLQRNLAQALRWAERDGLTLTLEPLNRADMPRYHYHLPAQVLAVVQAFDSPHLRLQFDYYHCLREGLDLQEQLRQASGWIGHVQIAGAPARDEPDLTQDGLRDAVAALPQAGYRGWIGCEYRPRTTAAEGLAWAEALEGVVRRPLPVR